MSTPTNVEPIVKGRNLVKRFGSVTGLNHADFDLYPGEVLAVIGDNGAGKSTLIKCFAGAHLPDEGEMWVQGEQVEFKSTHEAREHGVETVFQTLAVAPALDISANLYLGRELRKPGIFGKVFRQLDKKRMRREAGEHLQDLGIMTVQNITQSVETLSGGQRQAVSVARAAAFGSQVIILDEPTAALGVRESAKVLDLDPGPAQPRHVRHLDFAQHAAGVRGSRSHPRAAPRPPGCGHHSEDALDERCGGHHDRRAAGSRERANPRPGERSGLSSSSSGVQRGAVG